MKPYASVVVLTLLLSATVTSHVGYRQAEALIRADMNHALAETLARQTDAWLSPDTLTAYRNSLTIEPLRQWSFVSYDIADGLNGLCSERQVWQDGRRSVAYRSYATCPFATIWMLSDQRPTAVLLLLAVLWTIGSVLFFRRQQLVVSLNGISLGGITYAVDERKFYDVGRNPMRLTPMQHRLLEMFFTAEGHHLSKTDICNSLWPKKPDASETLYTLIRRLKPIVETGSRLHIESDRGQGYRLEEDPKRS
ncbi:MAG: helix-turn-helix domain-containing protein [Prevotella sp.]|nr:helix-turn-helix domain-containing protein [Prevotella sp.]